MDEQDRLDRNDPIDADQRARADALRTNTRNEELARSAGTNTAGLAHTASDAASAGAAAEDVGEAAGGITGVVAGASIGSIAGPIGTIIGGIAGAVGGWWAGRAIGDAAQHYTEHDDTFYRDQYEGSSDRLADRSYEQVRPAYQLGHLAAHNPEYAGRPFEVVEPDLRRGWDANASAQHGEWQQVRGYARDAYARAGSSPEALQAREAAQNAAEEADRRLDDTAGVRYF